MLIRRVPLCALLLLTARALAQTPPTSTTQPATAPTLLPIPTSTQQSHARDMIHTLYTADFAKKSSADRLALASLLLKQAQATTDDPAARYVALIDSADLAANAGDPTLAFSALAELARSYSVDLLDLQRQALLKAHASTTPDDKAITLLSLDTGSRAAQSDDFTTVSQLTDLAESSANRTRQVSFVASIQLRLATLRQLIAEFARVQAAFARLDKTPADPKAPDAHLIIGTFYALHKNQWDIGLPHLALSSDPTLRDLAAKDLAHPTDPLLQVQLGDAWWDYAQKATGLDRASASAHAAQWYKSAQSTLQGITLARIQSRLQSTTTVDPDSAPLPSPTTPVPANTLNLLALINPSQDTTQGKWSLAATPALTCDSSSYATLTLPYHPPAEFDLTISFTRTAGSGPIALLLNSHNHAFDFSLDSQGTARFERVSDKVAKDNPTVTPIALSNGHPYTLTVQIRTDSLRALLDNKLLIDLKTDFKNLSRYTVWKISDTTLCGIGANNAAVTFTSINLTEITGHGKPTR